MPERRAWPRLPLALPVFVRGKDREGNEFLEFTTALNVSAGGMLVGLRRNLHRTARVQLEVPSAPAPKALGAKVPSASQRQTLTQAPPPPEHNLQARLVRVTEAVGWKLCGFRFVRPLDSSKRETAFRQ
ncbi:MAG: PilZ domain-containing protein [Terriglobales bacterium]